MPENSIDSFYSGPAEANASPFSVESARPLGVTLLSALHVVSGVAILGLQGIILLRLEEANESMEAVGVSPAQVIAGITFLAILLLASGVGMWRGKMWGWWLAALYYVHNIVRNVAASFAVLAMVDQIREAGRGTEEYYIKHGGRIGVSCLLILYLCQNGVLRFFGLETLNKVKAIGLLLAICIARSAAFFAIEMVLD